MARAVARQRGAFISASAREACSRAPTHLPGTDPTGDATAPTANGTKDYLRHEEHALRTASGHADPASTVFRPFGASCMPSPAPSRDGAPSPRDVTAVTTNPVTGGSSMPVSCLLGDRNALFRASPALSM